MTGGKGHYHPNTLIMRDIVRILGEQGFSVALGPELDIEHYNFNMLNVSPDHPARDMQDTFWLKQSKDESERRLLRTQTSNMQIRYMEEFVKQGREMPIRIVSPGRVFRNEATDARHEAVFNQIEGLVVGENITLGDLKGTLEHMLGELFGGISHVRLRPGYFPFVEPGVEVDATCPVCAGSGTQPESESNCSVCHGTGWLELMGAGMVHPTVLRNVGIDPDKYQGFAFGTGIERLAMVKYGIDDLRLFNQGDLRLVNQFEV